MRIRRLGNRTPSESWAVGVRGMNRGQSKNVGGADMDLLEISTRVTPRLPLDWDYSWEYKGVGTQ
jgi:hypothetical protein